METKERNCLEERCWFFNSKKYYLSKKYQGNWSQLQYIFNSNNTGQMYRLFLITFFAS